MPKINASPAWKKRRHWSKERTAKPKRQTHTARLIVLLNKPYDVLCQFTDDAGRATLADYVTIPGVYAAGRLDRDSEGLLLLTNDGQLQAKLTQPGKNTEKTYWVQVDGAITDEAIAQLRQGVTLNDGPTKAARVERFTPPADLWPRDPPVRYRAAIPTTWIAITISEGRNRQVRRMTAAVGYPTLRLIRYRIGPYTLDGLAVGQCRTVQEE